ncbi:triphosphoribosyl-dephospho-CoA synthase [Mycolicibacterium rutilum]|uniref:triphosphoribosyl-dephospho-CoA synthase n=1 Tax=Mycolicibacterium rutilum TaxID=370526 RepID=A0A1H6IXR9_MYCRU|nr:triphosphoribosyl-dephospho-CoA synthase [Mycolicibacterium rutilum]SEH53030.1 triphosphoribosyl-dephospho-CoA synthase [Mycolicibacterium rutilum]
MTSVETPTLTPAEIAELAVTALHDEADLTPKPGLVDRRGPGAHRDMSVDLLHTSAEELRRPLVQCAEVTTQLAIGPELRARIGVIGRDGETAMLDATGGVNTHRGALWALGLLCAAAGAGAVTPDRAAGFAAELAGIPDPGLAGREPMSHGSRARQMFHVAGAKGEAQQGFPTVIRHALPTLRCTLDPRAARLDALISVIAHLDDTCLLHRGGAHGLADVQAAARAVIAAGGVRTPAGWDGFGRLDRLCARRRLSPGGAGDLLAAAIYLDALDSGSRACRP